MPDAPLPFRSLPQRVAHRRHAVAAFGWVCLAGAAVVLATQLMGTPFGLIAVIQSFTPWMPIVTLAVAFGAWLLKTDLVGAAGAGLTLAYLGLMTPVAFAGGLPDVAPGTEPLSVAVTNVLYSNDRIDDIGDAILGLDADVVTLIEATPTLLDGLADHPIADRYPHRYERPELAAFGMAIWSRHPLSPATTAATNGTSMEVVIGHPDGPIRLVGAHPPPPVVNHAAWLADLERIPDLAAGTDNVVVLGDFNASWFHPPFREAVDEAGLTNAAMAMGEGLAMTWPAHPVVPAFVAIDHVLVGDALTVVHTEIVSMPGSDHRALVADVAFADR